MSEVMLYIMSVKSVVMSEVISDFILYVIYQSRCHHVRFCVRCHVRCLSDVISNVMSVIMSYIMTDVISDGISSYKEDSVKNLPVHYTLRCLIQSCEISRETLTK